jgi:dGTPase
LTLDLAFLEQRRGGPAGKHPEDRRSEFERDRARILHSASFRRLQGKTQVHDVGERDFFRTRMTHSLECAQIGRALALRLWTPPFVELVEAACLAHDLGHPPFGHTGESVLAERVSFEGNAQTFRLLSRLEAKTHGFGLDLCRATLLSTLKYPFRERPGNPKFIFADDEEACAWVLEGAPAGLADDARAQPSRAFSTELMEWADDVAYSTHDLEDGLVGGFIDRAVLADRAIRERVLEHAAAALGRVGLSCDRGQVDALFGQIASALPRGLPIAPARADVVAGDAPDDVTVKALVNGFIHRLVIDVSAGAGPAPGHPLFARGLVVPAEVRRLCELLKALVWICVIQSEHVHRGREQRRRTIHTLFDALFDDARSGRPSLWPPARRAALAACTTDAILARAVADYIAGMTDAFAVRTYESIEAGRADPA